MSVVDRNSIASDRTARLTACLGPQRAPGTALGILPGEGIGPEVLAATMDVLDAVQRVEALGISRVTAEGGAEGDAFARAQRFCQEIFKAGGAVLCGPHGGRFVYDLRRHFDLFCKLAPIQPSGALRAANRLKPQVLRDVDIVVVRDNAGGVYQGQWTDNGGGEAEHRFSYSPQQVQRIAEVAVRLAASRRRCVHVAIKDDGVPGISALWRHCAQRTAESAGVQCLCLNADYAAYQLIQNPREFDVLLAPNMLGDILADLAAVLLGSRGLSYSGNFSACGRAVYQTGHGAARDLAGGDRANPVGQILSLAMMLRESYDHGLAARRIEAAVEDVWLAGWRTDDLTEGGRRPVGTRRMGELVADAVAARGRERM